MTNIRRLLIVIVCVLLWSVSGNALALTWTGNSTTSDLWTDPGNWEEETMPGPTEDVSVDGGPHPREPLVNASVDVIHNKITIGFTSGTTPVTVTMTGGKLATQDYFRLGQFDTSKGILHINGGMLDIGVHWDIGLRGDADVVMNGSAQADVASTLFIPRGGAGQPWTHTSYLEMNDNAVISADRLVMRRVTQPEFTIYSSININDNARIILTDPDGADKVIVDDYIADGWIYSSKGDAYTVTAKWDGSQTIISASANTAWNPKPVDKSTTDADKALLLTWSPVDDTVQHDVYFGTNQTAVENADVSDTSGVYRGRQDPNSYSLPEGVELDQTYYWRIDEVFADGIITAGRIWRFTVAEIIDNFEDYDGTDHRIFDTWVDYFVNNTGATVGYFDPPFVEQTIVHDGAQSMPYEYDNDGVVNEGTALETVGTALYSEAQREWAAPEDWTMNGVDVLTVWFRGFPPLFGSFTAGPPMTMTARGTGLAGASDQFHFAYKPFSGNGSITARVDSLTDTGASAAGVMIRETLAADAMHATVMMAPTAGVTFTDRTKTGSKSTTVTAEAGITAPQWIRLTRSGRDFTAEYSANGTTWTALGDPVSIAMSSNAYVGLCLTSGTTTATCTAEFSNVATLGSADEPWQSHDIGIASNAAEPMYVALQDSANHSAVVPYPEPAATTIDVWTEWNIPLAEFTGVDPQAVKKISIGVGDRAASQPGGSGMIFVDEIRLRSSSSLPQGSDLMTYYTLDGDASDSSGNSYHGTVQGDPQWVDGVIDGALEFAADDYVSTDNKERLVYWTAACWVKSPEAPQDGPYGGLINRQGNYQVNWNHSNEIYRGGAAVNVGGFVPASFGPVEADTWYHIAATYDGYVLRAYKDGVLITSTEAPGVPANASRDMRLGIGFAGTLDEVRVYRQALTEAEVAELVEPTVAP